jgi:CRISPR-associated protein Cas1
MRDYYIFRSGTLSRQDNTLMLNVVDEAGFENKVPIPVEDVDSIFVFGELNLNTKLLNFLNQHNIMVHIFNYYGFYAGTFYPREFLNAGDVIVRQSEHYLDPQKRIELAREFVAGAAYGIIQNLKRYKEKCSEPLERIESLFENIHKQPDIPSLMAIEGNIREIYYKAFPLIINQPIEFEKRVKHPPDNMMNAFISFMNSLVYTAVLKEIYRTQLNPTVSFLHEPSYRRFSLALDVAEIFKPIFADRIIFSLLNNNKITEKHFDKDLNYAYLLESGRKIVVQEFDEKMNTTVHHKQLQRNVSYRRIIRLELYKIVKHIIGEEKYKSLKIWW